MISKCIRRLSFRSLAVDDKQVIDVNNNSSNKITEPTLPAPIAVKPSSWTTSLWDKVMESGSGERSNVMCRCYLQKCGDGQTMILSVILHNELATVTETSGELVARSVLPASIHQGARLRMRFESAGLEVCSQQDLDHTWIRDCEKQIVLSGKGASVSGLLGKLTITDGLRPLFELHLVSRGEPVMPISDFSWGAAGFRELATLLHLVDEHDDFSRLTCDLGFTEHELTTKLLPSPDPFSALLSTYQSRGGTPQELIRAMYNCSRVRGLSFVGGSSCSPVSRMSSQCSTYGSRMMLSTPVDPDLDDLEEAAKLTSATPSLRRKRRLNSEDVIVDGNDNYDNAERNSNRSSKRSRKESDTTEDWELDFCDAATIPVADIELDQAVLPPTPPATPLKRVTGNTNYTFTHV